MALVKDVAAKNLEAFLLSLQDPAGITQEDKDKIKKYSEGFSSWLVDTVKTASVTVAPGIPVTTAGSPTAQAGATTATGTGTIT